MTALGLAVVLIVIAGGIIGCAKISGPPSVARRKSREPQAICQCGHGYAFHNEDGRGCQARERDWTGDHACWTSCYCVRYTGPEPLPLVIP